MYLPVRRFELTYSVLLGECVLHEATVADTLSTAERYIFSVGDKQPKTLNMSNKPLITPSVYVHYVITSGTSPYGIAAVLVQKDERGI